MFGLSEMTIVKIDREKATRERGLKGIKNPKPFLGELDTGPPGSLRLRRSFRKSVSIYCRSAPDFKTSLYSSFSLYIKKNARHQFQYQRAKKVVSDRPGLVDFAIGLVNFFLNLPDGQVFFFLALQITEEL